MKEDVKKIKIEEYNYTLPDNKIAKYPLKERDLSKLLISRRNGFETSQYKDIVEHIPKSSFLVFNETRVIQARLLFSKNEHTTIEIFCLEPFQQDIQQAMQAKAAIEYVCLIGGARKWKHGLLSMKLDSGKVLSVEKLENLGGTFKVRFCWDEDVTFADILEEGGKTPLPPYLKRAPEEGDKERYQTVFAKTEGSVAAPTASLHFTNQILKRLEQKGVSSSKLTLHVGAGTFKPVDADAIEDHEMHAEEILINRDLLLSLKSNLDKNIIPVGTTAMRALESIYWLGYMVLKKQVSLNNIPIVPQWIPYESEGNLPNSEESLNALIQYLDINGLDSFMAKTAIIIAPSYSFKFCKGLITNFHQPKSTLLLLVSALMGEKWKEMYAFAQTNDFRFLSYGDGCLILDNI